MTRYRLILVMASLVARVARPQGADSTGTLAPVVITATRVPFAQAAPTASTTVLTGADLRARGITSVAAALAEVPGIDIVSQTGSAGALTSLFVRGGNSNYTKVLVDGVPLNAPGGQIDLARFTTTNVDRIEIVRGGAGVLYGSDAVTGVVQIFTRPPPTAPDGSVTFSAGSFATKQLDTHLGLTVGPLGVSAGASRETTDGQLPFNNQYGNTALSAHVMARPDAHSDVSLSVRSYAAAYDFPTDFTGAITQHNQYTTSANVAAALTAGRTWSPRFDTRLALTSNAASTHSIGGPNADLPDTTGGFFSRSRTETQRRAADLHADAHLGAATVATAGVTLELERARTTEVDAFTAGQYDSGAFTPAPTTAPHRFNQGYYAQLLGNVLSDITYSAGGRIDRNETFGTFATYRIGAGYRLPTHTRLHASLGTSFVEPTFEQSFSAVDFDRGNPALRPERALGWDAGVDQTLPFGVTMFATWFGERFHDLIDYNANAPSTATNYENVAAARADGVEAGVEFDPLPLVSLRAQYTGLGTRVTETGFDSATSATYHVGSRLLRRPAHTASATVTVRTLAHATVAATVRYVGARDDVDFASGSRVVLPGYTTVDLSAQVALLPLIFGGGDIEGVALIARVTNLFDRAYEPTFGFSGARRVLLVGARIGTGP